VASNPGVQNTVIAAVDAQFQGRIDLKSVLDPVLPPRAAQVLVPPLQGAADVVNTVTTKFVQSDAFQTVWQTVNRVAHTQSLSAHRGQTEERRGAGGQQR
jgi:hypothetical protein